MNRKRMTVSSIVGTLLLAALLLVATGTWAKGEGAGWAPPAQADTVPSTISYQGRLLNTDGSPVEGMHTMFFRIYAQESGGAPLWVDSFPVQLEGGLFHANLEVDAALFDGEALWLGVQVEGDGEELTPRQPLLPVPYALHALTAPWAGLTGVPAGLGDGDDDTTYTSGTGLSLVDTEFNISVSYRLPQGCAGGEIAEWNGTSWECATDDVGVACWSLIGNSGTDPTVNYLGTADQVSLTLAVSGTPALRLEPNRVSPNLVGGYHGNRVAPGVVGAAIGGGGNSDHPHWVSAYYGTVGGGLGNAASGYGATVGGGRSNTVSGVYSTIGGGAGNAASVEDSTVGGGVDNTASNYDATVGGGEGNSASGYAATIGGGRSNLVTATHATVGGGYDNTVTGFYATVPGGTGNSAGGYFSFAAGRRAQANNSGCFVWGDSTEADVSCNDNNRTIFRSTGGFYIYTDNAATPSGLYLAAGGSSWNTHSDRAVKENFQRVDAEKLLARLAEIPISTWNYTSQDPAIRHIGPMAQDFNALLPDLGGEGETYINTLDADGVALAAVQGLYIRNQELEAEVANLEARLTALETAGGVSQSPGRDVFRAGLSLGGFGMVLLVGLVAIAIAVRRKRSWGGVL